MESLSLEVLQWAAIVVLVVIMIYLIVHTCFFVIGSYQDYFRDKRKRGKRK